MPRILLALVLLGLAGCSTPLVTVRTVPDGVSMRSITVNDTQIRPDKSGTWSAPLSTTRAMSGQVLVTGVSEGGIEAMSISAIDSEFGGTVLLPVPAEIEVVIASGTAKRVVVSGSVVEPQADKYVARLERTSGPVSVTALGESGILYEDSVDPRHGQRTKVSFDLAIRAVIEASADAANGGEVLSFSAGSSVPLDHIQRYQWTFGDGTSAEGVEITHAFALDSLTDGNLRVFTVTLTVWVDAKHKGTATHQVTIEQAERDLLLDLELFPKRVSLHYVVGEEVEFKLQSVEREAAGAEPTRARMLFGDGQSKPVVGDDLARLGSAGAHRPLIIKHTYQASGRFETRVQFGDAATKAGEFRKAALLLDGQQAGPLIVTQRYKSTTQLVDEAWKSIVRQVVKRLEKFAPMLPAGADGKPSIAIGWISDANFEHRNAVALDVVERLTRMLVASGYTVLERRSQVLTRLAHEAVIDTRDELTTAGADTVDQPPAYLPHLSYGLVTSHVSEDLPLLYDIRLAGTKDRRNSKDESSQASAHTQAMGADPIERQGTSEEHDVQLRTESLDRPVLVAHFDTAEMLLVVELLYQTPVYSIEPAVAFSEELGEPLDRHEVVIDLRLRIVDRAARILESVDLHGVHGELAVQGLRVSDREPGPVAPRTEAQF